MANRLIWPTARQDHKGVLADKDLKELDLGSLIEMMDTENRYAMFIRDVFAQLTDEHGVIQYRQEILEDLLANESLVDCFKKVLPMLEELKRTLISSKMESEDLLILVWSLRALTLYADCMNLLYKALTQVKSELRSAGLQALREEIVPLHQAEIFQRLLKEIPDLQRGLERIASVSIGFNLDAQLQPVQATLLSINDFRYKGENIFSKLLAPKLSSDSDKGISSLIVDPAVFAPSGLPLLGGDTNPEYTAFRRVLFKEFRRLMHSSIAPIEKAVKAYTKLKADVLLTLMEDLAFYLGAVQLVRTMQRLGLPMCRPELKPAAERIFAAQDLYNINLAINRYNPGSQSLTANLVLNDVEFSDQGGRIFVLTGPNSGGKTVFAHAVALIQVLAQAGLYVPCRSAAVSPADRIFCSFNVEEGKGMDAGKLGQEAKQLQTVFQSASRHSLVMLNESFSSTSPGESLYMLRDIVYAMRMLGMRSIITTHLHELAAQVDELNNVVPGDSKAASLVAIMASGRQAGSDTRSFKIMPLAAQGLSYAKDIAIQYGISLEQLTEVMQQRGQLQNISLTKPRS